MTAAATFRALRRYLVPSWLSAGEGGLVGYALDVMRDAFVDRLFLGLVARLPGGTILEQPADTAPADALVAMGRDRRVVKGMSETPEAYAERLRAWLDDRKRCGNPFALMQKLAEYTGAVPSWRVVDSRGNWYSREADGTESYTIKQENWNWSGTADMSDRWSRFWVICYPRGLWTAYPYTWGESGAPVFDGTEYTLGSTATHEQVTTLRAIVSDWKPAGTRCVNIILALDVASFDPASPEPDGLWEHWSKNVAGVQVPARLSTARYLDGSQGA